MPVLQPKPDTSRWTFLDGLRGAASIAPASDRWRIARPVFDCRDRSQDPLEYWLFEVMVAPRSQVAMVTCRILKNDFCKFSIMADMRLCSQRAIPSATPPACHGQGVAISNQRHRLSAKAPANLETPIRCPDSRADARIVPASGLPGLPSQRSAVRSSIGSAVCRWRGTRSPPGAPAAPPPEFL